MFIMYFGIKKCLLNEATKRCGKDYSRLQFVVESW